MILHVTDANVIGDYVLKFTYKNWAVTRVELSVLFRYPAYKVLEDRTRFLQFGLRDTIYWEVGLDVAPEYLYGHGVDV